MRRARRYAPAVAFAVLGVLELSLAHVTFFQLRGGLLVYGGYVLLLQIVLTLFLVTAIDDGRNLVEEGLGDNDGLTDFYASKPLPALGLGFGVAASLMTIASGWFGLNGWIRFPSTNLWMSASEVVLGVILVLTTLMQVGSSGRGIFGWCAGFAGGCSAGLIRLANNVIVPMTLLFWMVFAAVLCGMVFLLRVMIARWKRRTVAA